MENLAVCIPLDSGDIKYLNRCLRSVKAQTRRPDQIVISASRCTAADEREIRLICFDLGLQARIQTHSEILLAGANRNRAAKVAVENGATILFFFDSDDVMHPRRTQVIADHFKDASLTGVLNRFIGGPKEVQDISKIPWRPIRGLIYMNAFRLIDMKTFRGHLLRYELYKDSKIKGVEDVACGPATVRARFWLENPYSEIIRIGEDQHFTSQIVVKGGNLAYIPETLSVFMMDHIKEYEQCRVCCDLDYVKQDDMLVEVLRKRLEAAKAMKDLIEYRSALKRKMDEMAKE
jgi:hypothetical protein